MNYRFFRDFMEKLLLLLFVLSIVILPSGSAAGVNVKVLLLVLVFILAASRLCVDRRFIFFSFVLLFLMVIWFLIASVKGVPVESSVSAATALMSSFAPVLVVYMLAIGRPKLLGYVAGLVIFSCAIYGVVKLGFFLLAIGGGDVIGIFETMYTWFGYSPITYNYGWFFRINTPVDFVLVPAIILIVFLGVGREWKFRGLLIFVLFASIVISLSRYLYFYFAASFLLFWVFCNYRIIRSSYSLRRWLAIFFLVLVVLLAFAFSLEEIWGFIYSRYFGEYAGKSDSIREYVYPYMVAAFIDNCLFGGGIGYYVAEAVFFEDAPWNSVLLWLSILIQFGVVGTLLVAVLFMFPLRSLKNMTGYKFLLAFSYFLFLFSGVFNTFLLTSSVSMLYFLYFYGFTVLAERDVVRNSSVYTL